MSLSLHHLALRTSDLAGLCEFYSNLFELPVVREALPRSVWLGLGGGAVLMLEARAAGEPTPSPSSMEVLVLVTDEAGRIEFRDRCQALGCYDGETEFTVYARDPEGRRIGVSCYDLTRPA